MTQQLIYVIPFPNLLEPSPSPAVATANDEPIFVEQIDNVTVTAGRDVKLTCAVENLGTYKVSGAQLSVNYYFDFNHILSVYLSLENRT